MFPKLFLWSVISYILVPIVCLSGDERMRGEEIVVSVLYLPTLPDASTQGPAPVSSRPPRHVPKNNLTTYLIIPRFSSWTHKGKCSDKPLVPHMLSA